MPKNVDSRLGRLEQAKRVRVGEPGLDPDLDALFDALEAAQRGEDVPYDWSQEQDPTLREYFAELDRQEQYREWLLGKGE